MKEALPVDTARGNPTSQSMGDGSATTAIEDALSRVEQAFNEATLLLIHLEPLADRLKAERPGWREQDDDISILIRWIERLRGSVTSQRLVSPTEASTFLGLLGNNGKPTDKFYVIAKQIGVKPGRKWLIPEDRLHDYARGQA